jgi:hypothetical protein
VAALRQEGRVLRDCCVDDLRIRAIETAAISEASTKRRLVCDLAKRAAPSSIESCQKGNENRMHLQVEFAKVVTQKDANWLELFGPKEVLKRP